MTAMPAFDIWLARAGDALALVACAYALLRCVVVRPRAAAPPPPPTLPPISVLKPLCGAEPLQYEHLRSYFVQDYPVFQLVFGVRHAEDPALFCVARLRREFPRVDVTVVVDARLHGANPKVSNLLNLLPSARYDTLVMADADIAAPADCLRTLAVELQQPQTGLVTCLYRSIPTQGLWSQLGALFIDDWFAPSARVGIALGLRGFGFGATMALRRDTLARSGGFEALADQLADDWWLAEHVRRLGLQVRLSSCVVGTLVDEPSLQHLLDHERRWMRVIRSVRPAGYATMVPSFTLPLALLGAAGGGTAALWLLPLTLALRLLSFAQSLHGGPRRWLRRLWLLPLRELLLLWVWLRGFGSDRLRWRDRELDVDARGLLHSVAE